MSYNPDAYFVVNSAIRRTEQRLERLKLRRQIADIDRKLDALKSMNWMYQPRTVADTALLIAEIQT